jgi:hypothetical protein
MFKLTLLDLVNPMATILSKRESPTPSLTPSAVAPEEQPNLLTFFNQNLPQIIIIALMVGLLLYAVFHGSTGKLNWIDNLKRSISFTSNLLGSEIVSSMTYYEAIRYFVEQRQNHPKLFTKGAILLEKTTEGYIFIQVFLDEKNDLVVQQDGRPYGRRLIVNQLDDELLKTFDQKPLVIVE